MPPSGQRGPAKLSHKKRRGKSQHQLQGSRMNENGSPPNDIHFRDIAPAIEFVCWIVVELAPILWLINGAAVTGDQFVIQIALFSVALIAAMGLRVYQIWR